MANWTRISGYITIYPGAFDKFIAEKFYELEDDESKDWEVVSVDFNAAAYLFSLFKDNCRNSTSDQFHMLLGDHAALELQHKKTGQQGRQCLYLSDILPKDADDPLIRKVIQWPAGTEGPLDVNIIPTNRLTGWMIILQGSLRNYNLHQFIIWWEAIKQLIPADSYCVQAVDKVQTTPYCDIKYENFD